jgi:hypothetical protein
MATNPLSSMRRNMVTSADHPMMQHARIWQHVNGMEPNAIPQKIDELDYAVPLMGQLAGNPKTSRKDIIKAAADAVGARKIDASQAISLISQIPDDQAKIQPWLRAMYATNLTALVHLKAAAIAQTGGASSGVPQPVPSGPPQGAPIGAPTSAYPPALGGPAAPAEMSAR